MVRRYLGKLPPSLLGEVIANLRAGVVLQNVDGTILACNPSAPIVLHMTADELLGRSALDPAWRALDENAEPMSGQAHPTMVSLRTGKVLEGIVMAVRGGNDELVWLQVDCYPTELPEGPAVLGVFTDITAVRAREMELRGTVEVLQRALLPEAFPLKPWLVADGRYQAPTGTIAAGGDFYDLFEIDGGRSGFFIGDVCGHGVTATSTMALARYTLRGVGHAVESPVEVLERLNEALLRGGVDEYCTAVYGVATRAGDGGADVVLAVGGHPLPVLLPHDGPPREVGEHGTLLGFPNIPPHHTDVEVHLRPGDQLLLYTDGLLECPEPRATVDDMLARIHAGPTPTATIEIAMANHPVEGRPRSDDTALLVLAVPAPDDSGYDDAGS
ncbi:MAG: SpoIIE family protein phosphatase [Acidimicrobiales bacterium]|nr:SpoIIE family protein phosphatase [Acidimicrobiales bacterium]